MEEAINGVNGMEYITSNSTSTGPVSINTTFKVGTNVDIAALDVQNRVGIATPLLPSACKPLGCNRACKKYKYTNAGGYLFS